MTVLIGVDAGGSHTEAGVSDVDGTRLATARGEPGAATPGRESEIAESVVDLVRRAMTEGGVGGSGAALVVGAAGAGDQAVRDALRRALDAAGLADRVEVTTDIAIALESAFPGQPGILLIAGTGSVAVGRDAHGRTVRVGGHGWRFGDEGSAYDLARTAVSAAIRSIEGRDEPTSLVHALVGTALMAGAPNGSPHRTNRDWLQHADRRSVAALAPLVLRAWEAGDRVAAGLVQSQVRTLADHLVPLARRLGPGSPIAFGGGLLTRHAALREALAAEAARRCGDVRILPEPVDPVEGALRLAARLSGPRSG